MTNSFPCRIVITAVNKAWQSATTRRLVVLLSLLTSGGVVPAHAVLPTITSLSASSGVVGSTVIISGLNFGASQFPGLDRVTVNGADAGIAILWNMNIIEILVPTGATPTGNIFVTVGTTVSNLFPFGVVPSITSLSLTSGPQKMGFVIAGFTFGNSQGASTVKIGATPLTVVSGGWSDTAITVQVPTTAVTGSVVVTVAGNSSKAIVFTVVSPFGCP